MHINKEKLSDYMYVVNWGHSFVHVLHVSVEVLGHFQGSPDDLYSLVTPLQVLLLPGKELKISSREHLHQLREDWTMGALWLPVVTCIIYNLTLF